ncbi:MAG: hypothetical protein ACYDBJ_11120 [Aggregatilineales bacterium]
MSRFARISGRLCLAFTLVFAIWWATAPRPSLAQTDCSSRSGNNTPCFGPKSGSLVMDATSIAVFTANVTASDFIANVTFSNPYSTAKGSWDYGIFFRRTGPDQDYRLVISSTGDWVFDYGVSKQDLDSGKVPSGLLDTTQTGKNALLLIVSGNDGLFFLNNTYVAHLDTSAHTDSGDVTLATGLFQNDYVKGASVIYKNFNVWPSPLGSSGGGSSGSGV